MVCEGVTVLEIGAVAVRDVLVVKTIALHSRAILYAIRTISKD